MTSNDDDIVFDYSNPYTKINRDEILQNIREFGKVHAVNRRRREDYMVWKGRKYCMSTLDKYVGGWRNVLKEAEIDYDPQANVRVSIDTVNDNISKFCTITPTNSRTSAKFFAWEGCKFSTGTFRNHYRSWHEALSTLGFECKGQTRSVKLSDEEVLQAIETIWRWSLKTYNRPPLKDMFKEYINSHTDGVSTGTIERRFGTFSDFMKAFSKWKNGGISRSELLSFSPQKKHIRDPISKSLRYKMIHDAGKKCQACGKSVKEDAMLHVDHIMPVSKGGTNELSNLRVLCSECNLGRSNKFDTE